MLKEKILSKEKIIQRMLTISAEIDIAKIKTILAVYADAEDLINIGAYKKGSNSSIDDAIAKIDKVNEFLKQSTDEKFTFEETVRLMEEL